MRSVIFGLIVAAMLAGCAVSAAHDPAAATCPHAQCLVCKANADLACIDVAVDSTTPSYAHNGKTYYFCSEECRDRFARNLAKYVAK